MHFIAKSNMFFSRARLVTALYIACISIIDAVYANPHVSSNPHVLITKTSQGDWSVTYSTDMPVNKIVFMRNPDTSRTSRWSPLDREMMLAVDEKGAEYIARKDGNAFDHVSLSLTPSYTHLPKDYAPFSPFSDGGHLSHSGRYFACVNTCENVKNEWQINVQAPPGEHIIVNGAVYYKPINWVDSDSGRNFYVGKQSPVEGDSFIALVDEQLPNILKDSLTEQLPKLMQYFESKLGIAKGPKPMLFASYSNKPGSSSQGGTLPDQIFMHWDFDDLDERVKSREYVYQTLWFYAHEAAHFFQKGPTGEALFGAPEHSWIHEGGAEWMAKLALSELYPDMLSYIQKKETQLQQQCEEGLTQTSLIKAADLGLFRLHYSCGYFVHRVLAADIQRTSEGKLSTFDMWLQFGDVSVKSDATSVVNFWTAVEPLIPPPRFKLLKPVLENPGSTAADFWQGVSFH